MVVAPAAARRKGGGIDSRASSSKITDRTACDGDVACGKVSGCLTRSKGDR